MSTFSDDTVAIIGGFCADTDVVALGTVGTQWLRVLRSNRVWLPRQVRWRFGSTHSNAASSTSMSRDAFDFFLHRSRIDLQTACLLTRYAAIVQSPHGGGAAVIGGLAEATQHNGRTCVVIDANVGERMTVMILPNFSLANIRERNLCFDLDEQITMTMRATSDVELQVAECQRTYDEILAFGADAIDVLLRLQCVSAEAAEGAFSVRMLRCCERTATVLLDSAMRAWAVSKWHLFLRDPGECASRLPLHLMRILLTII